MKSSKKTNKAMSDDLPLFSHRESTSQDNRQSDLKKTGPKHWSVSEITAQIRGVLEPSFLQVWVQGEVSNYRPAASGHAYFTLKDENASLSVAMFGWGARRRSFELKDGLKLLCRGKITVYPPRGNYQLNADHLEPLGQGDLQAQFEVLKTKLAAEGLFDSARKKSLPPFPLKIAVVTSPSGAAIQDMLNILKRRAPQISVLIIPALVQGEGAPAQLIRGIQLANDFLLGDVLILARGGGSIEDLWCFNDEGLAREISQSKIPVISAVGHEIDFTIADFVADLRAPTPSAAAEIVSGNWTDVLRQVHEAQIRMTQVMQKDLANRRTLLEHVMARLVSPGDQLRNQMQRCDELWIRLERSMRGCLERAHSQWDRLEGKLLALSPLKVLERGYTIIKDPVHEGRVVKSAAQVESEQLLEVIFHDGTKKVRAV